MFTKIAIALAFALALGTTTGALAATKKKPKVTQTKDPYELSRQIHRDTYMHDFRGRKVKKPKTAQ